MSNLNTQTEQAREAARKQDGKFGSWEAGESAAELSAMVEGGQTTATDTEVAARNFEGTIDWYRKNIGEDYPATKKDGFNLHPGEAQAHINDAAVELARAPGGHEKLLEYFNDPQYQGDDDVSRAVGRGVAAGHHTAETDGKEYLQGRGWVDSDRPLGNEAVKHGDPLKVDDGFAETDVVAHGNFDNDRDEINVDNGNGLILAVNRSELRRRPTDG